VTDSVGTDGCPSNPGAPVQTMAPVTTERLTAFRALPTALDIVATSFFEGTFVF
jgi:hypothetical protein